MLKLNKEELKFEFKIPFDDDDLLDLDEPIVVTNKKLTELIEFWMKIESNDTGTHFKFSYELLNTGEYCDRFNFKIKLASKLFHTRNTQPRLTLFEDAHDVRDAKACRHLGKNGVLLTANRLVALRAGRNDTEFNQVILTLEITTETPQFTQHDLKNDISDMFENEASKDITFRVEGDSVKAHSFIINARSKALKTILEYDCKDQELKVITIEDTKVETFKAFIKYLYTESVADAENLIDDLIILADKYFVEKLKNELEHRLVVGINEANFLEYLLKADRYNCAILKKSTLKFICSHRDLLSCIGLQSLKGNDKLYQEIIMALAVGI